MCNNLSGAASPNQPLHFFCKLSASCKPPLCEDRNYQIPDFLQCDLDSRREVLGPGNPSVSLREPSHSMKPLETQVQHDDMPEQCCITLPDESLKKEKNDA